MTRRVATPVLAVLALLAVAVSPAPGQDPAPPKTPAQLFKDARDLIGTGNYELAAESLDKFLAANPTDAQYLDIEKQFGAATFLRLRNVLKWSDNKAENAKGMANVETVIAKHLEATKRTFTDPGRIAGLVQKLGSYREERLFAEQQLKIAGVAALPEMLNVFRGTNKPELQAAIVGLLPRMPVETVPMQVAALDGLSDAERVLLLGALAGREDVLALLKNIETDFTPYLWYFASSSPDAKSLLQDTAAGILRRLYGPSVDRTKAEIALTSAAEPIAAGKAVYRVQDPMDKVSGLVRVWRYDPSVRQVKSADVPRLAADEYYGLKYLRWALERNPAHAPAQRLFTSFATERAVERAKFGDLSKTEPAVYQILAAAPTELLTGLLELALAEKRTALALGMLQALGDRAHKDTATAPGDREHPSPLVRALNYDDPRVQFAAAVALVRQPGPPTHGKSARVVEILRQALAADADGSGAGTLGRALIADTNPQRGEGLAQMFRAAGFAAERYASGRQLVARLSKASDYDMIVVDRNVADPLLADTLTQVTADANAARRPVFVVASTDKPKQLPFEILMLRLANLVAATDDGLLQAATGFEGSKPIQITVPQPFAFDPLKPVKDRDEAKYLTVQARDRAMIGPSDADRAFAQKNGKPQPSENSLFKLRLERLQRLVEAADLPTSQDLADRLALRLPQLVLAGLVAEFEATTDTAPRTLERLTVATKNLLARRDLAASAIAIPDLGNLMRIMTELEGKLSAEQKDKLRFIQERTIPARLALPTDYLRDADLEAKLAAQVKRLKTVHVLPEPFAPEYLKSDIEEALQNPAQKPRDPAERVASAKVAVDLLRRMAVGELPGYDVRPAEAELRASLRVDALTESAIEAVARLGSKASQEALVSLAVTAAGPVPVRTKAADAAIRHVQAFGKLTEGALAEQLARLAPAEPDLALRAKLGVLTQLLSGKPADFGGVLKQFPVTLPTAPPPKPKEPAPPPKQPDDPKM